MDPLHRVLSTPELLRIILSHVPHEDDMNCALTCKLWADIARDFLWHCVRDLRPLLQLLAPLATDDDGERYVRLLSLSPLALIYIINFTPVFQWPY